MGQGSKQQSTSYSSTHCSGYYTAQRFLLIHARAPIFSSACGGRQPDTRVRSPSFSLSNNAKTHTACMYTICVYTRWLGGRWVRVQCYAEGERVSAALSREICDEASLMRASDQVFSSIYIMMGGNEVAYVHMYVPGLGRLRFMLYIYIFTLKLFSKALNENLTYLNAYTFEQKNNPSSLFRMVVEFYFFSHLLKSH